MSERPRNFTFAVLHALRDVGGDDLYEVCRASLVLDGWTPLQYSLAVADAYLRGLIEVDADEAGNVTLRLQGARA